MQQWIIFLVIGVLIIGGAIAIYAVSRSPTGSLIGGDRDEHGCLGPAGYSYDPDIGACVRPWEVRSEPEHTAAMAAANSAGVAKGLTVVSVTKGDCTVGCWDVVLDRYGERTNVTIEQWVVTDVSG